MITCVAGFWLKNINTTALTKNGKQETKWCEEGKCTIISLIVHENEQNHNFHPSQFAPDSYDTPLYISMFLVLTHACERQMWNWERSSAIVLAAAALLRAFLLQIALLATETDQKRGNDAKEAEIHMMFLQDIDTLEQLPE